LLYDVTNAYSFTKVKEDLYPLSKQFMQAEYSFHALVGNKADVVEEYPEMR
jgi:hypothetical protein